MSRRLARAVQPVGYLLAPVLAWQGLRARLRMPRLPITAGPRDGVVAGPGPATHLLVLGESSAAGIGAATHRDALAGRLAAELAAGLGGEVRWQVIARIGATAKVLRRDLLSRRPPLRKPDVVVLLIGVNDLMRVRPLRVWKRDLRELLAALPSYTGPAPVVLLGMPPIHRLPALPRLLRAVLGLRALAMDDVAARVAATTPGVWHLRAALPAELDRYLAQDRFHPSPAGYQVWAGALAPVVATALGRTFRSR